MDKKGKRNLFILLGIIGLLIIMLLIVNFNNPINVAARKIREVNNEDEFDSNLKIPENFRYAYDAYTGGVRLGVIATDFNYWAEQIIPKYYKNCKNMSENELNDYYNKNSEIIKNDTGYLTYNEFKSLINYIKEYSGDKIELQNYEIIRHSNKQYGRDAVGYLRIEYNNISKYFTYTIKDNSYGVEHAVYLSTEVDMDEINELNEKNKLEDEQLEKEMSNTYIFKSTGRVY